MRADLKKLLWRIIRAPGSPFAPCTSGLMYSMGGAAAHRQPLCRPRASCALLHSVWHWIRPAGSACVGALCGHGAVSECSLHSNRLPPRAKCRARGQSGPGLGAIASQPPPKSRGQSGHREKAVRTKPSQEAFRHRSVPPHLSKGTTSPRPQRFGVVGPGTPRRSRQDPRGTKRRDQGCKHHCWMVRSAELARPEPGRSWTRPPTAQLWPRLARRPLAAQARPEPAVRREPPAPVRRNETNRVLGSVHHRAKL